MQTIVEELQKELELESIEKVKNGLKIIVRHREQDFDRFSHFVPVLYTSVERFEIFFNSCVSYTVTETPSFTNELNDEYIGESFRYYQNSQLLDTFSLSKEETKKFHYSILCKDYVIDVVGFSFPDITFLTPVSKPLPQTSRRGDREIALSLIKETLTLFGDSIVTNDFSRFYEKISKVFKAQYSIEDFHKAFNFFIQKRFDIAPYVQEADPILEKEPKIEKDHSLVLNGHYENTPTPLYFKLKYLHEEDELKLISINVEIK